ncbi:outer membrane beta-barrel protein [Pseudidiomarina sp.]|uniref:outer membrane beta-barrel protein n=1 Tax=Pseudidiomarina sp. TaxID=2081707 RepID=UPI00299D04F5|nr:outer membrane beta-barrel protein [Pseudidiomarina sp.]MDX1706708.1 outer membrane beta-barrel protein [Pseudidiomarina sp.]
MKRILIASAITAALSAPTMAQNTPSFDFVSADYQRVDSFGEDFDGFGADFSRSLTPNVFVEGAVAFFSESGVDLDNYDIGLGYRHALSNQTHTYGVISAIHTNVEFDSPSLMHTDDTGWGLAAGVRHRLNDMVELDARLQHVDIFDDSDIGARIGAKFFRGVWSFDIGYNHQDSENSTVNLGVSYHF